MKRLRERERQETWSAHVPESYLDTRPLEVIRPRRESKSTPPCLCERAACWRPLAAGRTCALAWVRSLCLWLLSTIAGTASAASPSGTDPRGVRRPPARTLGLKAASGWFSVGEGVWEEKTDSLGRGSSRGNAGSGDRLDCFKGL